MAAIRRYIAKFGKVVLIDEDHPLAIAQRGLDAPNTASNATSNAASTPAPIVGRPVSAPAPSLPVDPASPAEPIVTHASGAVTETVVSTDAETAHDSGGGAAVMPRKKKAKP